jgi:hypothetical protein
VIKPTASELLSGVAMSLRERVLPEIPPGTTRRQIQAAIGILRRISAVWDKTGPYIHADNKDIEETLRSMLPMLEGVIAEDGKVFQAVTAKMRRMLDQSSEGSEPYPSPDMLGSRNIELQEVLAELQETLYENPQVKNAGRSEVDAAIRDLLRRMLARELEISSPARR